MANRPKAAFLTIAAVLPAILLSVGSVGAEGRRFRIFEVFSPDGGITRVSVPVVAEDVATAAEVGQASAGVIPLHLSGPSSNRFDIVILGDGYTQGELDLFHQHAADQWGTIKATEPFASYVGYFNIWMVDVVSNESGVDNDPLPIVKRDTALDMEFWCGGNERLLCMNNTKAEQFATLAPDADQVLGLANSTKYGGAGGEYATSSGGNALAAQITVHELGHSIGGLADEYDYYFALGLAGHVIRLPVPYLLYTGPEPAEYNISAKKQGGMAAAMIKWWRWLGEPSPDGTTVSTYQGGGYYKYGIYRPTDASLMRVLGKPFNLPSREKMTQSFYEQVEPIDAAPPTDAPLDGVAPVSIEVLQPETHDLTIDWYLDGALVAWAHNDTTFQFPAGDHAELRVKVVDETPFVRNPGWIANFLTQEMIWTVEP